MFKFTNYICKFNALQTSNDASNCRLRGKGVLREIFEEDFPNPKRRFFACQERNAVYFHEYVESGVDDVFIIRVANRKVIECFWGDNIIVHLYLYVIVDFRSNEPRFMIEIIDEYPQSKDEVVLVFTHSLNRKLHKHGLEATLEKQDGESNLPECLREEMKPLRNKARSIEEFYGIPDIYAYYKMKKEEKKKKKKKKTVPGITFTGGITINGPMFDLRNIQHAQTSQPKEKEQKPADDFQFVNLVFFDPKLFGTYERQLALSKLLKEASKRMDLDTGRDLVVVYIAYHFLIGKLRIMEGYTDMVQDVDCLMPNMLGKVKKQEGTRNQRYKYYIESLSNECKKWFIDKNCLPDVTVWKSNQYRYNVDDTQRIRIQELVTDLLLGMKEIIRS